MLESLRHLLRRQRETTPILFDEVFLRRLERLALRPDRSLRGGIVGTHRSPRRTPAAEMVDHRPYTPGDDLRYVDWHAFARHDYVFVKLGEAAQDVRVHLLLDHSASMGWGRPPKLTAALRLAAAIGYVGLAAGDTVSVTPFARTVGTPLGPIRTKRQAPRLLEYLAGLEAKSGAEGTTGLDESLQHMARSRAGGLLVVVSDLMASGWAETLRTLRPPRWQTLVLHLLHPAELAPTLDDDLDLEDAETGARVPIAASPAALAIYRERVNHWCAEVQTVCVRLGASYARIQSDWPVEQVVVPYLRRRRMLD